MLLSFESEISDHLKKKKKSTAFFCAQLSKSDNEKFRDNEY